MANLSKLGARAFRIKDGSCYTGCNYGIDEPRGPDGMPPMYYNLTVSSRHGADKSVQYTTELSEEEMLDTIAEWLKKYTLNRREEKKRYAKQQRTG